MSGREGDWVTVVEPSRGWPSLRLEELWRYRELLTALVARDLKVRYKQTFLGVAWAVLQPLIAMVLFTLIFGRLAKIASEGVPYSLFAFTGLVPWYYFSNSLTQTSLVLVNHQHIITKVYFPRLLLPFSALLSGLLDLFLNLALLVAMMFAYGYPPSLRLLWLPALLLVAMGTACGFGLWLSALHVLYRDVRFVVPFLVQIWLFATPIVYPSSSVPEQWRFLLGLNPMAGVMEGFRFAVLGTPPPDPVLMAMSLGVMFTVCLTGLFFFRRVERTMADRV